MKFSLKSGWDKLKKNEARREGRGVIEFNTYLRREGCWEITHMGGGGVQKGSKI
jgi:hypothetical protein